MNKLLNFLKGKYPPKFILAKLILRLNISEYFLIKMDGYFFYLVDSALSISYFVNKKERFTDAMLLKDVLVEGDVVVDVGANIGTVALPAALHTGENGTVYCFEPHPQTYEYLKKNIIGNGLKNIKYYCLALGDKREILKFTSLKSDDQNKISEKGNLEVNVVPLDSVVSGNVDFLKIDTEGYEYLVLKGASETLKNTKLVFLEFNTTNNKLNEINSEEIIQLLLNFKFKLNVCP